MMRQTRKLTCVLLLSLGMGLPVGAQLTPSGQGQPGTDPGEVPGEAEDHTHAHDHDIDPRPRFMTDRVSGIELPLTDEEDSFFFVVYGDRTGGPAEGVRVLAQAVEDTNILKPDLVMTVGDLIQGYGTTTPWLAQMREFKGIMDELECPWYPVAGNHDIYWRGADRPENEHEENYEEHFGPLWYAFEHKNCLFVVLHSDEGDEQGRFDFNRPQSQTMSDEQFDWLSKTLDEAEDAAHVFVFIHHPRWHGGRYGNDWDHVHERLVEAGNVTAVFAGHIHRMSYDGVRDGIEYVTLATTGGGQSERIPAAGYLHHYDIVSVRGDRLGLAAMPVGGVIDVRAVTPEIQQEAGALQGSVPQFQSVPSLGEAGIENGEVTISYRNPTSRPVDLTMHLNSADSRWRINPSHVHGRLDAGQTQTFTFGTARVPAGLDEAYRGLEVVTQVDYLGEQIRVPIPPRRDVVPIELNPPAVDSSLPEKVLALDGDDALVVPHAGFEMPDGAITVECWVRPEALDGRIGFVCKTEMSEYGLMQIDDRLSFSVFLDSEYASAEAEAGVLKLDQWQHVAGVFDGEQVRLYIDGQLVAAQKAAGVRRTNALPLVIGGDVDSNGNPNSMLIGEIDAVRLSDTARYNGEQFDPQRHYESDEHCVVLHTMQAIFVGYHVDASESQAHARMFGDPQLVDESAGESAVPGEAVEAE